jgi:hypothetical protein
MSTPEEKLGFGKERQARLLARFDQLIQLGTIESVAEAASQPNAIKFAKRDQEDRYLEWHTASVSFLESVLGQDSLFTKRYKDETYYSFTDNFWEHFLRGLGILRAARGEIEFGPLPKNEELISGEIFNDFIEMAEFVFRQDCWRVVPSLAGAVL